MLKVCGPSPYFKYVLKTSGVDIYVLDLADGDKSAQEELVDDMMSLIASFSGRLYGMRSSRKKQLIKEIESL